MKIVAEHFCDPSHVTSFSALAETVFKGDSAVWSSSRWPENRFIFILQRWSSYVSLGHLEGYHRFIKPHRVKISASFPRSTRDILHVTHKHHTSQGWCLYGDVHISVWNVTNNIKSEVSDVSFHTLINVSAL